MARIGALIRATPVAGYVGCCHAIPKMNVTDRLGNLRCATLVLVGEQDAGTPVAMAQEIAQAIPGARLEIIPDAAHLSNIQQATTFNRLLREFLDAQH
jgi:3-oxoadipate enol-lactonase